MHRDRWAWVRGGLRAYPGVVALPIHWLMEARWLTSVGEAFLRWVGVGAGLRDMKRGEARNRLRLVGPDILPIRPRCPFSPTPAQQSGTKNRQLLWRSPRYSLLVAVHLLPGSTQSVMLVA
jgi:hypothetical protein